MDFSALDARLGNGEELRVTYQYPVANSETGTEHGTRTDRLLAVEPSNGRAFVSFRGEVPVWIESSEILSIEAVG